MLKSNGILLWISLAMEREGNYSSLWYRSDDQAPEETPRSFQNHIISFNE
jgi:hypothetical protein